jgi:dihydroorotate dehydrogenase
MAIVSLASLGFAVARPVLQFLDAERAHRLTIRMLEVAPPLDGGTTHRQSLRQTLFGLTFQNPLGLAPGFDKNAEVPDALLRMGFGFVEIGTVTPRPQQGNAKPRLFRLQEDRAVINRMGFNNDGAAAVARRLDLRRNKGGLIGVNIGANKDSEDRIADYAEGVKWFGPRASYLTVNISSPNTPGLRGLQSREELQRLLERVNEARHKLPKRVPMLLKIAPDLADPELADIVSCTSKGEVDGVIISNTTLQRPDLASRHRHEQGGLSGLPLFALSTRQLAKFHQLSNGRVPLVGVGGISDVETAWSKIVAGASLIQLYSTLVYHGPQQVNLILEGLAQKLRDHHLINISEAVGLKSAEWAQS